MILVFAVATGLRQGEILGLFWEDVDLERGILVVRRTLSREKRGGEPALRYGPPKGRATRSLELSQALLRLLEEHRKGQIAERLAAPSWADSRLVFTTREGKPVHRAVLLQSFKRLCKREGLPAMTFHELRHTCATLLAQRNTHPNTVKAILGHTDVRVTLQTYSHEWPGMHKDAAEGLSELLF